MTGYSQVVAAVNPDGTDINSVTVNTNVVNLPAVQPVNDNGGSLTIDGSVGITGQPIQVTMAATAPPSSADIRAGALSANGTLLTVPAGRIWRGSISLSASITVAGNASCSVSVSGAGAIPTGVVHQVACQGLALTALSNSNTISDVYIYGGSAGATVSFAAGAGSTFGQATGILL